MGVGEITLGASGFFFVLLSLSSIFAYIMTKNAYRGTINCNTAKSVDSNTISVMLFASLITISSLIGIIAPAFGGMYPGYGAQWVFLIMMIALFVGGSFNNGWQLIGEAGGVYCILQTIGGVMSVASTGNAGSGYEANATYNAAGQGTGLTVKLLSVGANGSLPADKQQYEIVTPGSGYTLNEEVLLTNTNGSNGVIRIDDVTGD